MQLLYVWIEEFRNIKDLGFNFSSEYEVEYFKEADTISINKREGYVEDFFCKNICDVTAIIGKNATGKSNVLDFVCTTIVTGKRPRRANYLYVFKEDNTFKFFNKLSKSDSLKIDIPKECDLDLNFEPSNEWDCIFYSNVADGRELSFEGNKRVQNLSYAANLKSQSNKISYISDLNYRKTHNEKLSSVESQLSINELSFINTIEAEKLINENIEKDSSFSKYKLLRNRYKKAFRESKSNLNLLNYTINFSLITFLYCKNIEEGWKDDVIARILAQINQSPESKDEIAQEISSLNPIIQDELINIDNGRYNFNPLDFENFMEVLKTTDPRNPDRDSTDKIEDSSSTSIVIGLTDSLITMLSKISSIYNYTEIIKHDWAKLSSGLKAYLNLFSNVHSIVSKIREENVLLCIDEGDLYFHPEMQRCFLNDIIGFLERIFKDKTVQVILTSHSPFLVSDLPKENLILLKNFIKKKDDKEISILGIEKSGTNTFASNIYQLFNNQFFLDKGTIGEFSKSKISELLQIVNKKEIDEADLELYERINSRIGDEIIRLKMEELLFEKRNSLDNAGQDYLKNLYLNKYKEMGGIV